MRNLKRQVSLAVVAAGCLAGAISCSVSKSGNVSGTVPADVQAIFNKPLYKTGTWGIRAVDLDTGQVIVNLRPDYQFHIASVRKTFIMGEMLNQVGPDYHYDTPVYRQGSVDPSGVLQGDLILVASGDLTMGGRTNPDGSIAFTYFDHNEANALGNAVLSTPDPLAGYAALAKQIAAAGIREIKGDIAIDDRLFEFNFRNQFNVKPIFVNDDAVDVIMNPTAVGMPASVTYRPVSAALTVKDGLMMTGAGTSAKLNLQPPLPDCIGQPGCTAEITGNLPIDYVPPITGQYPLVQTFRIVQPSNYARTVLIEQLQAAGVKVDAPVVEENPVQILPPEGSYSQSDQVALLTGMTFINDAKLVLKVSYNIGADVSLMLWGLTQGVNSVSAALGAEQLNLAANYGIQPSEYSFPDGSGGGDTTATPVAVTQMLSSMYKRPVYPQYSDAMPSLGVDGSLQLMTDFESDPTLAGAKGQVHAKTGTDITEVEGKGPVIVTQALAGYADTKSGRHLAFEVVVNDVSISAVSDLIQAFQDEATISAILWRNY